MTTLPCIYYLPEQGIGDVARCLMVNEPNEKGEMYAVECEEVLRAGRCPKGKNHLSAKERGIMKKSIKRHEKALKAFGGEIMIISFRAFRDKIESGEKKQTIRRYNERRFQQFTNVNKYQLYWGSPRNGGELIKEVDSLSPYLIRFDLTHGIINTGYLPGHTEFVYSLDEREELARADGFKDYHEMIDWFIKTYGPVIPFNEKFMVLGWE